MNRSTAAQYAKMRRDEEALARDALKTTIPDTLFTPEIESNGMLNSTAKVLVAAKNQITNLQEKVGTLEGKKEDLTKRVEELEKDKGTPFSIPTTLPAANQGDESIRQLRQVAQRIVHKAEGKLLARGGVLTEEDEKILEAISDSIIDQIEKIEDST